jgi:hypothetical protein
MTITFSLQLFAARDGIYTCGSKEDKMQFVYEIKNIDMNGTVLPLLNITKTVFGDSKLGTINKTYTSKGMATHFSSDDGSEYLSLGNTTLEIVNGRPSCVK